MGRAAFVAIVLLGAGCGGPGDPPDACASCLDGGGDAGRDAARDAGHDARAVPVPMPCDASGHCPAGRVCVGAMACGASARGECVVACDVAGDGAECGPDAACSDEVLAGRVRFVLDPGACRARCTPSTTADGCELDGFACDPATLTCMEACCSDEQCEQLVDAAGDIVRVPGSAVCNATTGRCEARRDPTARPGDPCASPAECEPDGWCLGAPDFPGGYCTRFGCTAPGFECADGATCDVRAFGAATSACVDACTIGAETTRAERVGAAGGNPTCDRPGYRCTWDGVSTPADRRGSCLPGNYNDEPTYDVGTACLDDGDCFSPFGHGRCLFVGAIARVGSGICAIAECAQAAPSEPITLLGSDAALDPGVRDELCAAPDRCLDFAVTGAPPSTFCIATCATADECPPAYACPALLADGGRICWPYCQTDADCRPTQLCRDTTGTSCGIGEDCSCADATPPDGGP